MHNLGYTRSARRSDHALLTPDTFVRAALPGMERCTAVVHAGPALGARFTEYTAEFEPGGVMGGAQTQRFVYVLSGTVRIEGDHNEAGMSGRGYAYFPEGLEHRLVALEESKVAVIEKPYQTLDSAGPPELIVSSEDSIESRPLNDDPGVQVKCLLPDVPSFDFAVNVMTYQPGAALSMVEMHVMEHGLLMLEGGGIYRLGGSWYPVAAGDFIWMAPWCPQWFGAIGRSPAKYLIYKDWNRHP